MKTYGANKTLDIPRNADLSSVLQALDLYDRNTRKVVSKLLTLQQRWIDNEGLQGIQRSKELLSIWTKWCGNGYQLSDIAPSRYKHSLIAKLQYAMRLVVRYEFKVDLINLISTALRLHQCYGVSDAVIEQLRLDSYNTITDPNPSERAIIFGLFDQRNLIYGHGLNESSFDAYTAARKIQVSLDLLMQNSIYPEHGLRDLLSNLKGTKVHLQLEHMEKLTKAGPHNWIPYRHKPVALKSILSEPLDAHAMDSVHTVFTRQIEYKPDGTISLRSGCGNTGRTVHNIVDDINNLLLAAPHRGELGLSYSSAQAIGDLPKFYEANLGRIVPIKDKAGKIRNIAMTCYTVNKTLGPIHRWLFSLLEKLPCDSTKQYKGVEKMLKATSDHKACESKDLSSATDRLPLVVQRRILEFLLSYAAGYSVEEARRMARYWHELLASLTFKTPDGNTIRYAVGQPMGVYTSWPALALTNHIIAITACVDVNYEKYCQRHISQAQFRQNVKDFINTGYQVCGDDIVIYNHEIAEVYHFIMEGLGVSINRMKSFSTLENASTSTAEFCKKLAVNGDIVSGQSLKVVLRGFGIDDGYKIQPMLLPQVMETLKVLCPGSTLSKRTLRLVANSYPHELHHIPTEFGGLGFPLAGSSCCQVLAKDAFILYYYYSKVESMLSVFNKSEFRTSREKKPDPATIPGQLSQVAQLAQYSKYPDNQYRRYDLDYRQLANSDWFTDKSAEQNMFERLTFCKHQLKSMIETGEPIDYIDWIDIVETINQGKRDFIKSRFTVAARVQNDPTKHDEQESIDSARTALKAIRRMRSKSNLFKFDSCSEELRSVLVSFSEYALT